jgi:hypothetical protein
MHEDRHFLDACRTDVPLKTVLGELIAASDNSPLPRRGHSQTLLPSASRSLKRTVSAPARIEPAEPLRICRHMLSISTNDFIAGSTSH